MGLFGSLFNGLHSAADATPLRYLVDPMFGSPDGQGGYAGGLFGSHGMAQSGPQQGDPMAAQQQAPQMQQSAQSGDPLAAYRPGLLQTALGTLLFGGNPLLARDVLTQRNIRSHVTIPLQIQNNQQIAQARSDYSNALSANDTQGAQRALAKLAGLGGIGGGSAGGGAGGAGGPSGSLMADAQRGVGLSGLSGPVGNYAAISPVAVGDNMTKPVTAGRDQTVVNPLTGGVLAQGPTILASEETGLNVAGRAPVYRAPPKRDVQMRAAGQVPTVTPGGPYGDIGDAQPAIPPTPQAPARTVPTVRGAAPQAAQTDPSSYIAQLVGAPVRVTSGFRTPEHNAAVGGVPNSGHLTPGRAYDFVPQGMSTDQAAARLKQSLERAGVPYHQVLNEGSHVHVDFGFGARQQQAQLSSPQHNQGIDYNAPISQGQPAQPHPLLDPKERADLGISPQDRAGYMLLPNGEVKKTGDDPFSSERAVALHNNFYGSDEFKKFAEARSSYNGFVNAANHMSNNGVFDVAGVDSYLRTINPGASARNTTVQMFLEHLGVPQEVKGHIINAVGNGFLTPQVLSQMGQVMQSYVSAHAQEVQRRAQGDAQIARSYGVDPAILGEEIGPIPSLYKPSGAAAGASAQATVSRRPPPQPGAMIRGFRFKGGDPSNRANWEPVQ